MTRSPEELLEDIKECRGMCGEFCISCREMHCLREIYEVLSALIQENKTLRAENDWLRMVSEQAYNKQII